MRPAAYLSVLFAGIFTFGGSATAEVYFDPAGDTLNGNPPDLVSVLGEYTDTDLTFSLTFNETGFVPLFAGFSIDISFFSNPASRDEVTIFYTSFFDPSRSARIIKASGGDQPLVPVTFDGTTATVSAPLELLGGDGPARYGVTVGRAFISQPLGFTITDYLGTRNSKPGRTMPIPEPTGVLAALLCSLVMLRRDRQS